MAVHDPAHPDHTPQRQPATQWAPNHLLRAARLERGWVQKNVVARVRQACPGHGWRGRCLVDVSKVSAWENGTERPTVRHIEALCSVYGRGPEDLGLIIWRTPEETEAQGHEVPAWLRARLRDEARAQLRREVAEEVLAAVRWHLRGLVQGDGPPE